MHYSIGKRCDQWVISFHGRELMCCKQRKMAVRIARVATMRLIKWDPDMKQEVFDIPTVALVEMELELYRPRKVPWG